VNRTSLLTFLIDTGAELSVMPPRESDRQLPARNYLQAANGSEISVYCTHSLTVGLGLRRSFASVFTVAKVLRHLLGADFMAHFSLTVDF